MHITRFTDYAIRVLIYLAVKKNELSTISEIAESYAISKNHLMKIVQELNLRGYLLATRGKNGGIKLISDAEEINIGKLIRELEGETKLVECFGSNNQCVITPTCQLKEMFSKAMESFFATLDEYTLADLVGQTNRPELAKLLSIKVSETKQETTV